ncbi:zinc finger protein 569 [Leguminivora glycinivorella]|uniref:zinc finger protein 569 n=1 Tax=Leguminivora glycinivorella TaxID=1035111 RepID=UPI0020109975|nr:zinc finger protein 569 [Leguminivora glycinivorella]
MNKICRICLEEGVLSSVFTKNFNISLCDMIEYCCNVKIRKNDGLPEQLCSNCIYKLGVAYHFKQTCESADVRLRQYLGLQLTSKYNDAAVMTDPMPIPQAIIKKCKCRLSQKKTSTNYKKKPEEEKLKRGPKPKPKQVHACYECDKEFRCQAQLETHVRTHTGDKPFSCMYCSRRFAQKHNLTIHLRVHTGEKPFQCEVCSKTFSAQGNLQAHLKIHTGQKDHVCSLCNKSFITSSELSRHINKHRGVKNYKCDICGAAYAQSRDLKIHKMKKHQINTQNTTAQNDGYNNSSNIDIIGIDVGKESSLPAEVHSGHRPAAIESIGLVGSKEMHSVAGKHPPQISQLVQSKGFQQYGNKLDPHTCTVCGEVFDYITALAHHYLHRHKDCEPLPILS